VYHICDIKCTQIRDIEFPTDIYYTVSSVSSSSPPSKSGSFSAAGMHWATGPRLVVCCWHALGHRMEKNPTPQVEYFPRVRYPHSHHLEPVQWLITGPRVRVPPGATSGSPYSDTSCCACVRHDNKMTPPGSRRQSYACLPTVTTTCPPRRCSCTQNLVGQHDL